MALKQFHVKHSQRFLVFGCDLKLSDHNISFFELLEKSVTLKELLIINCELLKRDINCVIKLLNNIETPLNTLLLDHLTIKESLLCELFNNLKNKKKLKIFFE